VGLEAKQRTQVEGKDNLEFIFDMLLLSARPRAISRVPKDPYSTRVISTKEVRKKRYKTRRVM
jgi:hypothetical protein